jgi:hypothetical protein
MRGADCRRRSSLDLGDQGGLGEEIALAFERNERRTRLQRVGRLLEVVGILLLEARADGADIDPVVAAASCQQQAADPAARRRCQGAVPVSLLLTLPAMAGFLLCLHGHTI